MKKSVNQKKDSLLKANLWLWIYPLPPQISSVSMYAPEPPHIIADLDGYSSQTPLSS